MILEVKQGCFSYNKKQVLTDVDFQLQRGQTLSVMGPNGAGKTTLLKCIVGLEKWSSGNTFLDGKQLGEWGHKEIWKKIGYVPQIKNVVPGFTALDMVLLGRSAHLGMLSLPSKKDYELAQKVMDEVGIVHLKDQLCTCMSGGELQLVLIARALCTDPEVLVLDEPESNLDFINQQHILEVVEKLVKEKNISAIFTTHFPDHARNFSQNALLLSKSGKSTKGNSQELITIEKLKEAFQN